MFGDRTRRASRLSEAAAKNLDPGETVVEIVQCQAGQSAMANMTAVATSGLVSAETGIAYRAKVKAAPHLLVATERNIYAMTLSGARLFDVGEVVAKVPLAEAELRLEKDSVMFGGVALHVIPGFGDRARRLVDLARPD
jgi:hypothetical protein